MTNTTERAIALTRLCVGLGLLLACGGDDDSATQVIVEIDADSEVQEMATLLQLQVEAAPAGGAFNVVTDDALRPINVSTDSWPRRHVLSPLGGQVSRRYRVTAQALSGDGLIGETRATSSFVEGEVRVLRLFIPGGECIGVRCPQELRCSQGLCAEFEEIDPMDLPRDGEDGADAGGGDASTDASDGGAGCDPSSIECETANGCEEASVDCSSGDPVCVLTPAAAGTECRAAASECDLAETCDGESPFCPEDATSPVGTECGEALFCNAGECAACSPGAPCETDNPCELGVVECSEEGIPSCVAAGPADPGTPCRPAVDVCDVAETCDGESTTCPNDAKVPAGEICREVDGNCDAAETCDGESNTCPENAFLASGTECREGSGLCDPAEVCAGDSPRCPDDIALEPGAVCRPASDECDAVEACAENSSGEVACPADQKTSFGVPCGSGNGRVCDGAGMCASSECGAPCQTGNACERGRIDCSSGMTVCVPDGVRPSGTTCRDADGPCDVAEACDGVSPTCPPDGFRPATFECRAAEGNCDVAERCSGTSAACPPEDYAGAGTLCRVASAPCEGNAFCNGASPVCPTNPLLSGTTCRPSEGACDIAEVCSGSARTCPTDRLRGNGSICREGNALTCDPTERCTGSSPSCPGDDVRDRGDRCGGRPMFYGGVCSPGAGSDYEHPCLDIVISEVALSPDGFVELHNRFCDEVALEGCFLRVAWDAMLSEGLSDAVEVPLGDFTMLPGGFLLVGLDTDRLFSFPHEAEVRADVVLGEEASESLYGAVYCFDQLIDRAVIFRGDLPPPIPLEGEIGGPKRCSDGLDEGPSAERRATLPPPRELESLSAARLSTEFRDDGHIIDRDDNRADFVCQPRRSPQSREFEPEAGCRL